MLTGDFALIKRGILKILQTSSPLTALVSDRIYVETVAQAIGSLPAVMFRRIAEPEGEFHHGGPMNIATGLFQIDCFAESPDKVETLSGIVKQIFHGYKGSVEIAPEVLVPPTPAITITIHKAVVTNRTDLSDPDLGLYRIPVDVRITYKEF